MMYLNSAFVVGDPTEISPWSLIGEKCEFLNLHLDVGCVWKAVERRPSYLWRKQADVDAVDNEAYDSEPRGAWAMMCADIDTKRFSLRCAR